MVESPSAVRTNPLALLWEDWRADRRADVPFPPGETSFSLARTKRLERFRLELQPGYSLRIRHAPTISPERGLPMTVRAAQPAAVLSATGAQHAAA